MEDYLSKLNDQQRIAVEYCDGPQLVIAGAGSGKTRVLTYKIVHLLAHGYEPWRIVALTFTNKAAREMRERIEALVGPEVASKLWMGTFHSIFGRILRINADRIGFKSNYTIYDTADSKSLVKMIIKDLGLDDKVYKPSLVLNEISRAKNNLVSPQAYANDRDIAQANRHAKRDRMSEIYAGYMERCRVAGAMDFDDLLYYTNILLRDNPDVRHHYQEYFRYVLVDEYQDTNFAQHLIVSQLTDGAKQLCVVGDDAQSIYSFRGANIQNILNLKRAYPTLQIHKLEQNYRSTQNIINAANSLIEKNAEQMPKQVFSKNAKGDLIEVVKSFSDYEEAYLVANRVSQVQMNTGDSMEEFAILYRTNAQSRVLEEALRKRNIPYRIYGGLSFYQRKEVKDAIAYFRLSINPADDEALKRVINYPPRGIGDTTMGKVSATAISHRVSLWDVINDMDRYPVSVNKGTRAKLEQFRDVIRKFNQLNIDGEHAASVARTIITDTGLLTILLSDKTPESISRQENLEELLNGVQEFVANKMEEGNTEHTDMASFLSEVSLATDQDNKEEDQQEKLTLMTIHAAKGLEFGNVFIVGVEEELLPSAMSMEHPWEVEEERRLLYVAITRAKRFCMMSYATSRFRNGQTVTSKPSRFLADIDRKWLHFAMGTDMPAYDPVQKFRSSYHSPGRIFYETARTTATTATSATARTTATTRTTATAATNGSQMSRESQMSQASRESQMSRESQASRESQMSRESQGSLHTPGELEPGMAIEHSRFGRGEIIEVDTSQPDARIRVKFDNVEVKTLLLKFAKFTIL
ncbi:MAG: UvrD-helicase domain-containing protein [Bacteroidales bacterium]|nr:UvrD-helicase domain-containing protein [Bacteroidales bacterium]